MHEETKAAGRPTYSALVDEISSLLTVAATEVDRTLEGDDRVRLVASVGAMNDQAAAGDRVAFYHQQLLLARIYGMYTTIPHAHTAEGSVVLHDITRSLEVATLAAEDRWIEPGSIQAAPTEGKAFLSWIKTMARQHRVFKHPYYGDFINHHATADDLRTYVIQESLVDGRFDDLLALMQVGTAGQAKMEIASNFWDEMGNGKPEEVHTHLFNKIYEVFAITDDELESAMTASDLLAGNLALLVCRYRSLYPEAVGFLGMTEWLVPDRFTNVIRAWERLGLPDVGITYHRLHVTIDSVHAAGWFHNIVLPAATSDHMRHGIARGTLWRLNSSARHLDERLEQASAHGIRKV
ncbi:iron-containing redox enzyme family protein [Streptacidiphilus sp. EB129]|uniref:iron-containing redox enzyme family protein n=1 Tax=Streptacidiphilus sp. EB129 TaxID=3156262 RepID=UPI0035135B82